jgi:hypothetical protein
VIRLTRAHLVRRPPLGGRTCFRQQRVRCLAQSKAGQTLAELGEVHWKIGRFRRVGMGTTLAGGGSIRQRFAGHPVYSFRKRIREDFGLVGLRFKDGAANQTNSRAYPQARPGTAMMMGHLELRCTSGVVARSWPIGLRCCGTTLGTATLPQSARCQEPWHLSIQTVALPLRFRARGGGRWTTTCCLIGAYPIHATAHDFCYPPYGPLTSALQLSG